MHHLILVSVLLLTGVLLCPAHTVAEKRGVRIEGKDAADFINEQYGKSWAVVIGVNHYKDKPATLSRTEEKLKALEAREQQLAERRRLEKIQARIEEKENKLDIAGLPSAGELNRDSYLKDLTGKIAHVVLTAGSQDEPVMEKDGHGIFTSAILKGLSGEGDLDRSGFVTGAELAQYIQRTVAQVTNRQHPQYGHLHGSSDVILTGPTRDLYGKSWAIVIGINDYRGKVGKLHGAVADAQAMGEALRKLGFEVRTLMDQEATRANILGALGDEIGSRAVEEDRILVYFAGNADTRGEGPDRMGSLLPSDYDPDKHWATAIPMTVLREATRHLRARHVVYLFDTAFSGGIMNSR